MCMNVRPQETSKSWLKTHKRWLSDEVQPQVLLKDRGERVWCATTSSFDADRLDSTKTLLLYRLRVIDDLIFMCRHVAKDMKLGER